MSEHAAPPQQNFLTEERIESLLYTHNVPTIVVGPLNLKTLLPNKADFNGFLAFAIKTNTNTLYRRLQDLVQKADEVKQSYTVV
jgi:hypothetical protein